MLSRLSNRLIILDRRRARFAARQQTLRNSLDLSYSLLRPEEQTLFARLGVFVGGFTLETAEAVCNADGSLDLLEGVSSLMNNSLLRSEGGVDGQPRFGMLETIREYALERLEQRSELAAMQQAHALYYFNRIASEIRRKTLFASSRRVARLARKRTCEYWRGAGMGIGHPAGELAPTSMRFPGTGIGVAT